MPAERTCKSVLRFFFAAALVASQGAGEPNAFQVRGTVMPIGEELPGMRVARIRIESLVSPFSETTESDWGYGRFRFDAVPEGFYALSVVSRLGETRRVIEVRSSRSDESGRINLAISFGKEDGKSDLKRRFTVRASEVLVSKRSKEDYLAAEAYARIGHFEDAIPLLERAVQASPIYVAAWTKLGMIAFHSDRFAQAEGRPWSNGRGMP